MRGTGHGSHRALVAITSATAISCTEANGIGTAAVNLNGSTLEVQGEVGIVSNALHERLFDYDGATYLDPIDSGNGYLTKSDYLYQGALTGQLYFSGDHWQNAPGNFGALGPNGWDNIGGVWYGRMTIGGASPLPASTNITLATASDDGTVWWVDLNGNGVFESGAGELIVNNNFYQGTTPHYGLINLPAGTYNTAIGFYEGNGGEEMRAAYGVGNLVAGRGDWGP